jgi:nucleoid-associated protein YgaU
MLKTARKRPGILSVLMVSLLVSAGPAFAQDLGDAARQERERKLNLGHQAAHVYTNDDLKRTHILLPEDLARMLEARKNTKAQEVVAASNPSSAPATSNTANPAASISDVVIPAPATQISVEAATRDRMPEQGPSPARAARVPASRAAMLASMDTQKTRKSRNNSPDFVFAGITKKLPVPVPVEPKPVAEAKPVADALTGVRVAAGDSLWKIAQEHLGDGARWRELAAVNPEIADPNLIHTGEWIRLVAEVSVAAKQVVVRAGDTLTSVAQAELGNARAFSCIAQANPQLETADRIFPGQTLVVPQSCSVAR